MDVQQKEQLAKLREKSIFVAIPMYGGNCTGFTSRSLADLQLKCAQLGIEYRSFSLFNESLIHRARNYLTDEFLRSGATHLMFIDADIEFNPDDVITLLHYCNNEDKRIVCGAYPKKNISWEKIKRAVDMGLADENPQILELFMGDFVLNPVHGSFRLDEPIEVLESGTGFMMIEKSVFMDLASANPHWEYKPDHVRSKNFDGTRAIHKFFDSQIEPNSLRDLSEDYFFCQEARKIDIKTWLIPWIKLNHIGTFRFVGDLVSVLRAGLPPTADLNQIAPMKKGE